MDGLHCARTTYCMYNKGNLGDLCAIMLHVDLVTIKVRKVICNISPPLSVCQLWNHLCHCFVVILYLISVHSDPKQTIYIRVSHAETTAAADWGLSPALPVRLDRGCDLVPC